MGFTVKALDILEKLAIDLQQESHPQLKATGLRHLGISLRNLGKLKQSATVLQQSQDISTSKSSRSLAWLE
ncbi:MAG: hypothetical protein ACFCAD_04130 [Pleurocapsa sp.]